MSAWESNENVAQAVFLHVDNPDGFAFDAPLRDLAHQENISTAILDAKRLEYRPGTLQTEGSGWPLWLTIRPLLLGLARLAITVFISTRRRISAPISILNIKNMYETTVGCNQRVIDTKQLWNKILSIYPSYRQTFLDKRPCAKR